MKLFLFLFFLGFISIHTLYARPVEEGSSWNSGGGEILEHALNPWFLKMRENEEPIRYCVLRGSDFALDLNELEKIVERGINWWTDQLSNANNPDNFIIKKDGSYGTMKVILNTVWVFQRNCDDQTDLKFQFGYISSEQESVFENFKVDLKKYVALTIRTEYNDHLRGKGFIYFSPDRGEDAFRGHNLIENAWTNDLDSFNRNFRLFNVLIHELGHVMGLSHGGTDLDLMNAKLAENMVTIDRGIKYPGSKNIFFPKLFFDLTIVSYREDKNDEKNIDSEEVDKFFEIPKNISRIKYIHDPNQMIIKYSLKPNSEVFQELGRLRYYSRKKRYNQLITVWLPPDQKLLPIESPQVLLGPRSTEVLQTGEFKFKSTGIVKPMFLQASPSRLQFSGVSEGRLIPDVKISDSDWN